MCSTAADRPMSSNARCCLAPRCCDWLNVAQTDDEARTLLRGLLDSGKAARVFEGMVAAQGGDARVIADPSLLRLAPCSVMVEAVRTGYVAEIDPLELGLSAVAMGAGRTRADQPVDPGVGITLRVARGDRIERQAPLAEIHVRRNEDAKAIVDRVRSAFRIDDNPPVPRPLLHGRIE